MMMSGDEERNFWHTRPLLFTSLIDRDLQIASANKKDMVTVQENGPNVKFSMTRGTSETYSLFKHQYPKIKLGRTKIFSLHPK
ncbi:hypothetical protein PR048_006744 [Dryococelus australis]|uniref:Uncharacterized protein n=1 Tax=Dryococelus australis TaxID=614101 RepID=A0ABQ9IBT3_9NEOP|nr:hypothetical protein PR048_006744 [Dryococelus australis]